MIKIGTNNIKYDSDSKIDVKLWRKICVDTEKYARLSAKFVNGSNNYWNMTELNLDFLFLFCCLRIQARLHILSLSLRFLHKVRFI